jgi:hypothetical protein
MEKYVICLIIYDLFILWFHPLISSSSDSIPGRIPPLVEKYRKLAERKCPHRHGIFPFSEIIEKIFNYH